MLQSKEVIGRLDKRITFQSKVTETDESNADAEESWENVKTVWAKVEYGHGAENLEADQVKSDQDLIVTIRSTSVQSDWRISYDSKFWEIESVTKPDRNRFIKVGAFLRQDYV
jgi:SPP1 family predicted phage head-tail adaptor